MCKKKKYFLLLAVSCLFSMLIYSQDVPQQGKLVTQLQLNQLTTLVQQSKSNNLALQKQSEALVSKVFKSQQTVENLQMQLQEERASTSKWQLSYNKLKANQQSVITKALEKQQTAEKNEAKTNIQLQKVKNQRNIVIGVLILLLLSTGFYIYCCAG